MDEKLIASQKILKKYKQEHLLMFYNELTFKEQNLLLDQILNIDFEQINELYISSKKDIQENLSLITPLPYINKQKLSDSEINYYTNIGIKSIKNKEFAVCTMAGRSRYKTWF